MNGEIDVTRKKPLDLFNQNKTLDRGRDQDRTRSELPSIDYHDVRTLTPWQKKQDDIKQGCFQHKKTVRRDGE